MFLVCNLAIRLQFKGILWCMVRLFFNKKRRIAYVRYL